MVTIRWNLDVLDRAAPMWLDAGDNGQQVTVREVPTREQIEIPVREQLIVELYSK
jgi:small subunit ribosomal protein S4